MSTTNNKNSASRIGQKEQESNMNKLLLAIVATLTVSACTSVLYTVHTPMNDSLDLTDKRCPESRLDTPTEKFYVFRSGVTNRELGCYARGPNSIRFILAGNRSMTGQPEEVTYTYAELQQAGRRYNRALDQAILQTAPLWNQPAQAAPVQIAPYSCVRTGNVTNCY